MEHPALATFCGASGRKSFVQLGWLQTYNPPASVSQVQVYTRADSAQHAALDCITRKQGVLLVLSTLLFPTPFAVSSTRLESTVQSAQQCLPQVQPRDCMHQSFSKQQLHEKWRNKLTKKWGKTQGVRGSSSGTFQVRGKALFSHHLGTKGSYAHLHAIPYRAFPVLPSRSNPFAEQSQQPAFNSHSQSCTLNLCGQGLDESCSILNPQCLANWYLCLKHCLFR